MKVLGLDLGSKTLGIAVSDALGLTAQGVETFHFREEDYETAAQYVIEYVKKEAIETIVLGYPKHMNGTIGERGRISEQFKARLSQSLSIPIILWDERMTTMTAERVLINANVSRKKRKQVVDKMAAVVLLQNYLNSK